MSKAIVLVAFGSANLDGIKKSIGLLEKDGINAKAKVKRQLKRLLDTYFAEEESQDENKNQ